MSHASFIDNATEKEEVELSNNKNSDKMDQIQSFRESSATNLSAWFADIAKPPLLLQFNKLNEDISVDVAIVGGGYRRVIYRV